MEIGHRFLFVGVILECRFRERVNTAVKVVGVMTNYILIKHFDILESGNDRSIIILKYKRAHLSQNYSVNMYILLITIRFLSKNEIIVSITLLLQTNV